MSLFKKPLQLMDEVMSFLEGSPQSVVAVPKSDEKPPLVQQLIDEVNGYQREMYRLLKAGERRSSKSMLILDDRQSAVLKTLIHDIGVTPVIDSKSGFWHLYEGSSRHS